MYINKHNSIKLPFLLYSYCGKAEETALLDSGATENFVDYKTMARLWLGTKKLERSRPVINIDGTTNAAGAITHYCDLMVTKGDKKGREGFYVTNLGKDRFIFGYPWLRTFNLEINWTTGIVQGPQVRIETLLKGNLTRNEQRQEATKIAIAQLEEGDELYMAIQFIKTDPVEINKMTLAQQMAEKAYNTSKVNTEDTIPAVFRRHWKIFSEEESRQLPLQRKWDHKIELKPDAPDVINSKVYLLSKDEQKALDDYITDNLDKGYIMASSSPYGSPTFMVKKKDSTFRIVHDYRKLNEYTVMDVTPLPQIQSILEELREQTLFSKFDIRAGYNNI
jgi:hypothetical protein